VLYIARKIGKKLQFSDRGNMGIQNVNFAPKFPQNGWGGLSDKILYLL